LITGLLQCVLMSFRWPGGAEMLQVDLHVLERQDVVLDRSGFPASLGVEVEAGFCPGPITVHALVSKSGESYLARGWTAGTMHLTCGRCLKEYNHPFQSDFEAHYRKCRNPGTPGTEQPGEDADTVTIEGNSIDLADEVRQSVELSVPMQSLCRKDCRGFCAGCGTDLNLKSCRCPEPPRDGIWTVLKDFKPRNEVQ
jgi:uncharacterized protein